MSDALELVRRMRQRSKVVLIVSFGSQSCRVSRSFGERPGAVIALTLKVVRRAQVREHVPDGFHDCDLSGERGDDADVGLV